MGVARGGRRGHGGRGLMLSPPCVCVGSVPRFTRDCGRSGGRLLWGLPTSTSRVAPHLFRSAPCSCPPLCGGRGVRDAQRMLSCVARSAAAAAAVPSPATTSAVATTAAAAPPPPVVCTRGAAGGAGAAAATTPAAGRGRAAATACFIRGEGSNAATTTAAPSSMSRRCDLESPCLS